MDLMFLIWVFFVKGLWETAAVSVTGEVGDEVAVTCSHSNAYYNIKYFCRGDCTDEDVLIRTGGKSNSNGKYTIRDEGNTFYVTINHLKMDDSGIYWCGIERNGVDTYNMVDLQVKEGTKSKAGQKNASEWLVYIRVAVGAAVFSLAMTVLFILVGLGRRRSHSCSGKDHDTKQSTSCSTANGDKDTNGRSDVSRVHTDSSDGLVYSTVSFGDSSPAPHAPAAVVYATITH